MRPHSFAVLAVLLYLLRNATATKRFFTVTFDIYKGSNRIEDRSFQVSVDDVSSDRWKMRVNRTSSTVKYYCEIEIKRLMANKEEFIIKHNHEAENNHNRWIDEEVSIYSGELRGRYMNHGLYREFKTYQKPEPHNLQIYSDFQDHRYAVTSIY